jgi:hypothetical protein
MGKWREVGEKRERDIDREWWVESERHRWEETKS